jgi:hypothetical protein
MTDTQAEQSVDDLVEKSSNTDFRVLVAVKEKAKRAVLQDPSAANLAALDRATRMLENALQRKSNLKDWRAVLSFIAEHGRKLGKSKLYEDIGSGRLKRQSDGTFRQRDVERYMAGLPAAGTSDAVAEKAADRQRRKDEQEIRRIKAVADKEEFALAVNQGKFVPKEQVHLELAARAVTLASGIKSAFEARGLDIIAAVSGNPLKGVALTDILEGILDDALNEYSREMEFEITFTAPLFDDDESGEGCDENALEVEA